MKLMRMMNVMKVLNWLLIRFLHSMFNLNLHQTVRRMVQSKDLALHCAVKFIFCVRAMGWMKSTRWTLRTS